jgi:hypothetical protein
MPTVPALGRVRRKHLEFKASMGYITKLRLNKTKQNSSVILRLGVGWQAGQPFHIPTMCLPLPQDH